MWRAVLAIVLGICAEVVFIAVGEGVGLAAAFVAVATYFCVCQFLLSRGHADAPRKDWRIMLALAAPLLLFTIPMVLLEKPEVVLSQGPVVLFGGAGIFGGAMAASGAARRRAAQPAS